MSRAHNSWKDEDKYSLGTLDGARSLLFRASKTFDGLEVRLSREDISNPVEWNILSKRHSLIVHIGGYMSELETITETGARSVGPAHSGEMWFIPAQMRYRGYSHGETAEYVDIQIDLHRVLEIFQLGHDLSDLSPEFAFRDEKLMKLTASLISSVSGNEDTDWMTGETICQEIADQLVSRQPFANERVNRAQQPSLNKRKALLLQDYIYSKLGSQITLKELSCVAGMTTHNLLIAFRKTFYTTPAQYIIAQRLRYAMWLLEHSAANVTDVALSAGFSSHSHLTTTLKKHTGLVPTEFRRVSRFHLLS